jgi:hypothetical protein
MLPVPFIGCHDGLVRTTSSRKRVLGSNPDLQSYYLDYGVSMFFLVPPGKF